MDHRRPGKRVCVFLIVLALAAGLLSACGSSTETMPPATGTVLSAYTPTTGLGGCIGCHRRQTADWLTTKHANLDPAGNLYSRGKPTIGQMQTTSCAACHDPLGDSGNLTAGTTGQYGILRPVVGCESCHGAGSLHVNGGGMGPISRFSNTTPGTWGTGTVQVSGQFRMCTSCHGLLDPAGTGAAATDHDPVSSVTPTGDQYTITDTHFATPGSYIGAKEANIVNITGYAMDFADSTVCTDCHNPHRSADINREWSQSKHADKTAAAAWAHYNWSTRPACQRCHTTAGFSAYADALQSGDAMLAAAISNGDLATSPVTSTADWKPEMLKCNGCHEDNKGTLRNPGPYLATYVLGTIPYASVANPYPDLGSSNVCMPCHTGRGSGKAISQLNTGQTAVVNFSSYSYADGHYLSAGGTMFKGTAYEYPGRSYRDPASFKHKEIGTTAAPNTGNNGPCIGCHMERPGLSGNHRFQPVGMDFYGAIVNVSSEICFNCHAGSATSLAEVVNLEREDFEYGLEALEYHLVISNPSYSFTTTHPYFDRSDHLSSGDTDTTGNTTGKNNLGAAFNFSLLHHEPGAYIHNSRYVKRIIYDSIDWLDNHQMDYSVGNTLDTWSTTNPAKTGAMKYLLNQVNYDSDGKIVPGPAERP